MEVDAKSVRCPAALSSSCDRLIELLTGAYTSRGPGLAVYFFEIFEIWRGQRAAAEYVCVCCGPSSSYTIR